MGVVAGVDLEVLAAVVAAASESHPVRMIG